MIQDGLLEFSENKELGNYDLSVAESKIAELTAQLEGLTNVGGFDLTSILNTDDPKYQQTIEQMSASLSGFSGALSVETLLGCTVGEAQSKLMSVFKVETEGGGSVDYLSIIQEELSGIEEQVDNLYAIGKTAGSNLDAGLAEGINGGKAIAAAQMLAKLISGSFMVSWEMHSPSKLFQEFGQYLDIGLMKGIEENSNRPVDAATEMAEDSVSNVQSVLKTIQNLALDDMDITPTITPVVDMSNVTAAARQIQALGFNGTPFSLDTSNLSYYANAANPVNSREPQVQTNDYSGIISSIRSEIAALAGTMAGVSGSLSSMRVVLDSGAIVGGIIDDVDHQLGRRGFYAGREG